MPARSDTESASRYERCRVQPRIERSLLGNGARYAANVEDPGTRTSGCLCCGRPGAEEEGGADGSREAAHYFAAFALRRSAQYRRMRIETALRASADIGA